MKNGPRRVSVRREICLSVAALAVTVSATALAMADIGGGLGHRVASHHWGEALTQGVFLVIVAYLSYGASVYQLARLGHLRRLAAHVPATEDALPAVYTESAPPLLTVLVPSYMEEERVVRRTLLCSALQQYPRRRVVLLIDDPPEPRTDSDAARLSTARALPGHIDALLAQPRELCAAAAAIFRERRTMGPLRARAEYLVVSRLYAEVASWFEQQAAGYEVVDHADRLFVETTFSGAARECRAESKRFDRLSRPPAAAGNVGRLTSAYQRLYARFHVEITAFERKRYDNLSHAANKAMNLNSYIALLGKSFREVSTGGTRLLEATAVGDGDFTVPASEFLLIVDADSVLAPDYSLRLVHLMRAPGNERVAVAQTPYNAFPGARGAVERIAGATTDIQYLMHQGFTYYGATYWVGANAVVRTAALDDIAVSGRERGYPITRFIRDRTVIEDTESTVDLIARGWRLHNYPERLAYSETPPDFGSLLVQRRRWANGGLIIFPTLLRYVAGRWAGGGILRAFMMSHYLTSLAAVNVGLLIVLGFSFEDSLRTGWLPLAALPYYVVYAWDLGIIGYRRADVLRVYALNLVLIPVNLVGVLNSLKQVVTGTKAAFGRTPKVRGRTVVPAVYLVAVFAILTEWMFGIARDVVVGRPVHALLTAMNVGFLAYGITVYIGVRNAAHDLTASIPVALRWQRVARATPGRSQPLAG